MKKYIKIFSIICIWIGILTFSNVYAAEVDVQINGEIIDFTDSDGNKVNAQIINSRTMVPLRKIFEVLGCDITWDGSTRTVIAKKQDKEIILQIDNKIALKRENGIEHKITLDTAPTIVNDRTLVPLRFIAESLNKQVGWDNSARTAIIIDYDYFSNIIKQKNENLFNILESESISKFSVTRDYIDISNSANNNTSTIKGNIIKNIDGSNISLSFEGNNELIKEIASEGWNNIIYEVKYKEDSILIKTSNNTFAKILNTDINQYNEFKAHELGLLGGFEDNLSNAINSVFNIKESQLNVNTFSSMKTEFNKFTDLFVLNGTRTINYNNANLNMFDYTKFDSVVYGNEISTNLSFINKAIFNYDVVKNEMFYDWPKIIYNMNCQNNNLVLKITMENEYNEKVSYTITCESN